MASLTTRPAPATRPTGLPSWPRAAIASPRASSPSCARSRPTWTPAPAPSRTERRERPAFHAGGGAFVVRLPGASPLQVDDLVQDLVRGGDDPGVGLEAALGQDQVGELG